MQTTNFQIELEKEIKQHGVDFYHFVDISHLNTSQNKGFSSAILIVNKLSEAYVKKVAENANYVEQMKTNNTTSTDEFHLLEAKTDATANKIENYILSKGFKAFSQSEKNILNAGMYDKINQKTPLPHKTIATLAGAGWIGKNNLLVTKKYGSAISLCSLLTNAPLKAIKKEPINSLCGNCTVCENICQPEALKGNIWECGIDREKIVDVFSCNTCFQCVVQCPYTKKYYNKN